MKLLVIQHSRVPVNLGGLHYAQEYIVCLFHLNPPVTRKRRWRYILDEPVPAEEVVHFRIPVDSVAEGV